MKLKLAFIGILIIALMMTAPTSTAQLSQTATADFTDGLRVGDILTYEVQIDDNFGAPEDANDTDFGSDGDEYTSELTEEIPDSVDAEFSEFFGASVSFEDVGEFTTTFPNGTTETEPATEYVVPTRITLENGTVFEGEDAIALGSGFGLFGTTSESDGIVTVSFAFILIFRVKYDVNTGIMQEYALVDPDGEGEAKLVLKEDSGFLGLPAYDLPVFLALVGFTVTVVLLRSRKFVD